MILHSLRISSKHNTYPEIDKDIYRKIMKNDVVNVVLMLSRDIVK